ncbi:hypothetical protein niasHT_012840 [Heterodera trifolii]|uniref:Uncharacterized protein n=1 Tax=Heterodera trifolii TaxID=157864 RepID=A0ABD2KY79_9BILA
MDKCLLVGMDPTLLEIEQTPALHCFIQWLYQRRLFLREQNTNGLNDHIDTQIELDCAENYEPSSSSTSSIIQDVSYETIAGLSPEGRRTLQQWSDHYAGLLMSHLRINYGNLTAAQRFAELVHLLEAVLFSTKKHHEFLTYLAMVTEQDRFHAALPPIFVPMLLHGRPG